MSAATAERLQPEQDLSVEAFYERYGDVCGIEPDILRAVWDESQGLVPPDDSIQFKHHNALHVRKTVWAIMEICDREEAKDPTYKYNRRVLIFAGLFHEALFHTDHEARGFDSKEALAAHEMAERTPKYGLSPAEIRLGQQIIMATKEGEVLEIPEQEVMVEGDIVNVGQDYETSMKPTFFNLAAENSIAQAAKNETFSPHDFGIKSIEKLCAYLSALNPNKPFVKAGVENVRKLIADLASWEGVSEAKYIKNIYSIGNNTVNKLLGYTLFKKD